MSEKKRSLTSTNDVKFRIIKNKAVEIRLYASTRQRQNRVKANTQ